MFTSVSASSPSHMENAMSNVNPEQDKKAAEYDSTFDSQSLAEMIDEWIDETWGSVGQTAFESASTLDNQRLPNPNSNQPAPAKVIL